MSCEACSMRTSLFNYPPFVIAVGIEINWRERARSTFWVASYNCTINAWLIVCYFDHSDCKSMARRYKMEEGGVHSRLSKHAISSLLHIITNPLVGPGRNNGFVLILKALCYSAATGFFFVFWFFSLMPHWQNCTNGMKIYITYYSVFSVTQYVDVSVNPVISL